MKVWLTGGHGMLGTDLAVTLRARGHDLVVTDREVDITDRAAVQALVAQHRPSHIVNCAAYTAVDRCESEEELARQVNVEGPARLGEAARQHGLHAVHLSTDYVFAGDGTRPYLEDDVTGPLSAYGRTKLAGERSFLEATAGQGAVVRTSWLFGVNGRSFPGTMLKLMAEREELKVVADQHGRPTCTIDLSWALADVAQRGLSGIFHFANAGEVSWHGFACGIRDEALRRGRPLKVKTIHAIAASEYPTAAVRPAYSVLATAKIEAALGWAPRPWSEALAAYFDALPAQSPGS